MATFLKPDKTYTLKNGLTIKEYLLTDHNPNKIALPKKRTENLIGVTLHNTEDLNEAVGTTDPEQYTRATVNGNMGDTRVHYYVDDVEAWRNLSDAYTSWHAGTGGNGKGNSNTISIECIMSSLTGSQSVAAMNNAAKLIASIFKQYSWSIDKNLYTHNYWINYLATGKCSSDLTTQNLNKVLPTASNIVNGGLANKNGKYCPFYILPQWATFKNLVNSYLSTSSSSSSSIAQPVFEQYIVKVVTDYLNIRKGPGTNYPINGVIKDEGLYTIVEESNGSGAAKWGRLKSGAGWISLDFTAKAK